MKVGKTREMLEIELSQIFKQYAADKDIVAEVKEELSQHGISAGLTQGLINESRPMEVQPLVILCLFSNIFYKLTEIDKLNPSNWFTDVEISEAKKYMRDTNKDKMESILLDDVIQIAEDQWITRLSYKQIYDIWTEGRAKYNKDTQRNTIIKEYGDKIIEKINTNKRAIKSIVKRMSENTFISNTVTFNMLADGTEDFEYDDKNNKMIINSIVDGIDGFHRILSILEVVSSGINLDKNMEVRITNFNVDKCHQFMLQEDIRNPLDTKFKQSISSTLENQIVKRLNEGTGNELRGKITTNYLLYKKNKAYVMHDILANIIKAEFTIKNQRDVNNISEFLTEGFNEIVGIFYDDFNNLNKSRSLNTKTLSNAFIGYVVVLSALKDKGNWKFRLEKILNKIDFDLNNSIWRELDITNLNPNKTQINQIRKYFEKFI